MIGNMKTKTNATGWSFSAYFDFETKNAANP